MRHKVVSVKKLIAICAPDITWGRFFGKPLPGRGCALRYAEDRDRSFPGRPFLPLAWSASRAAFQKAARLSFGPQRPLPCRIKFITPGLPDCSEISSPDGVSEGARALCRARLTQGVEIPCPLYACCSSRSWLHYLFVFSIQFPSDLERCGV